MSEEEDGSSEVDKSLKVFGVVLIANDQATKVKKPGKETFNLPAPDVTTQGSAVLSLNFSIFAVGRNYIDAVASHQALVEFVAVVGLVASAR